MSDYLMRSEAPLSDEEWTQLDGVVIGVARQFLVGRQFVDLAGPYGAGLEVVPVGTGEARQYIPLKLIEQPFLLHWREIEASRKSGMPLQLGAAAQAAMQCARAEDELVLGGLLDVADKSITLGNWSEAETPLADIVTAIEALFADNCFGPYAVVLSPALYTQTLRVSHGRGQLMGKLIKEVAEGGIFRSPLLSKAQGLVLSLGAYNFDLVVGQDLTTGYEGNDGLDHRFRVLETVALRIKRPEAICRLEG